MNWTDFLVIAIIGVFGLIGLKNGFIYSMFRLFSFFLSSLLAVKFYPMVSKILMKTVLFANIKGSIYKNLMLQQTQVAKVDSQAKEVAATAIIDNLQLPGFMKGSLASHIPNPSKLLDIGQIMDTLSGELAKMVIDILALIVLYILIRVGLVFLRFILQGLAKLPLFKQLDKLGGFSFGAVEGLLTIYILFAFVMLFNASPSFKGVYQAIDGSMLAKFFYQNNFIINWMFPK